MARRAAGDFPGFGLDFSRAVGIADADDHGQTLTPVRNDCQLHVGGFGWDSSPRDRKFMNVGAGMSKL
jgi:hypothetical protein